MQVHTKQVGAAIKHIADAWKNGCQCPVCKAVDLRENIVGRDNRAPKGVRKVRAAKSNVP